MVVLDGQVGAYWSKIYTYIGKKQKNASSKDWKWISSSIKFHPRDSSFTDVQESILYFDEYSSIYQHHIRLTVIF